MTTAVPDAQAGIVATLDAMRLAYVSAPHPQVGRIWRVAFEKPIDCIVALSASEHWVNVVSLVAAGVPEDAALRLLQINGALALAKLGLDVSGNLLAVVHLRHSDVDREHIADAIRAVLSAVALGRNALRQAG